MNKTRIGLVFSAILVVALAASNLWFYTVQQNQIRSLSEDNDSLQNQIDTMQNEIGNLYS